MKRGEVRWAQVGRNRRPVLLLTRDAALPLLRHVTVAPATRTIRGIPTEVGLRESDGMPDACVLSFDNLTTIPKAAVGRRITALSAARLAEVCESLRYALGC